MIAPILRLGDQPFGPIPVGAVRSIGPRDGRRRYERIDWRRHRGARADLDFRRRVVSKSLAARRYYGRLSLTRPVGAIR